MINNSFGFRFLYSAHWQSISNIQLGFLFLKEKKKFTHIYLLGGGECTRHSACVDRRGQLVKVSSHSGSEGQRCLWLLSYLTWAPTRFSNVNQEKATLELLKTCASNTTQHLEFLRSFSLRPGKELYTTLRGQGGIRHPCLLSTERTHRRQSG